MKAQNDAGIFGQIPLETELACAVSMKEQDEILCRRVPEHVPMFRKDEKSNPSS